MVKGVKYDSYYYKMGVKKSNDNLGYFTPLLEKTVSVDEINTIKEIFLAKNETISKIDSKVVYHNKFCREWKDGDKCFLEYIMGFVSLDQND